MTTTKVYVNKSGEHAAYAARILIVDDNYRNRRLLEAMLIPTGFCVTSAATGEAALTSVARERPDLVLLDVMMPGMDGYEVARRLKADPTTQHIPIIMVTALDDREARLRGLQSGVEDFVTKPVDRAELCMRVRNLARLRTGDDVRYGDVLSGTVRSRTAHLTERTESLEREATALSERSIALEQMRIEQLKFKDDFLSHVSHELRSPLTAIKQFTSILLSGVAGPLTDEQREYQLVVWRNIGQLQSMIDDLLEVTRLESGKLQIVRECIALRAVVADTLDTVRESARARAITLSVVIEDDLPPAFADPTRLRQILIILLDNAVKFTPLSGSITVRVRASVREAQMLECDVSDTGGGISAERRTKVFERLYQGAAVDTGGRQGLGIGLYICRELVEAQGGTIAVSDETALTGTTFTFTVPTFTLAHVDAPVAAHTALASSL
ncbi:ATP-binding response regulator [Gemmatimonas groenlandica]|uniref:histidine kinase n=1 Tax=Gemmatimonas groenlandica TaxID=2732249 RepID=A0A6M4IK30_9BACT|nr:response regulator [Gemmatimonas groenlandica]QJR35424.1 response regulator [Gemmatimonas groenlandica]